MISLDGSTFAIDVLQVPFSVEFRANYRVVCNIVGWSLGSSRGFTSELYSVSVIYEAMKEVLTIPFDKQWTNKYK